MAFLLFFIAVVLSGIAAYYSVIGLIAIFSAAAIPVAIMGGSLEAAKLVVASWLYRYWKQIPVLMKVYFTAALVVLMLITSMGIFGFLSKAHSDQSLVSGDVSAKIAVYDEKIKTAKENIDANRKALKQMDEAVDQVMGRSQDEKGADKAVALRKGQAKERTRLLSEIAAEQKTITQLSEERAPIAAEIRKVEAEVGPLKYIAALVYGDNPDENMLERSVRWLIIMLICVFDPLAVLMLIAANLTQIKNQQTKEEVKTDDEPFEIIPDEAELSVATETAEEPVAPTVDAETVESSIEPTAPVETVGVDPAPVGWMYTPLVTSEMEQRLWEESVAKVKEEPVVKVEKKTRKPRVKKVKEEVKEQSKKKTPAKKTVKKEVKKPVPVKKAKPVKKEPVKKTPVKKAKPVKKEIVKPAPAKKVSKKKTPPVVQEVELEPVSIPVLDASDERPGDYLTTPEVIPQQEQVIEDKSLQEGLIVKPATIDEQLDTLIANNDSVALEEAYKKIVKEMTRQNRSKSTHWGPIKNNKNG